MRVYDIRAPFHMREVLRPAIKTYGIPTCKNVYTTSLGMSMYVDMRYGGCPVCTHFIRVW